MDTIFFLVQQTWFFAIPLLVVALGGLFSERSGVINIALEGIMLIGALCGIGFIHIFNHAMPPQLLLLCAVLVAGAAGIVFSLFHAFAAIHMKADQVISGTALNTFAQMCIRDRGNLWCDHRALCHDDAEEIRTGCPDEISDRHRRAAVCLDHSSQHSAE